MNWKHLGEVHQSN